MSAEELGERLMCSSARVSSHKVRTGSLSPDDHAKLVQAAGVLEKADIFIDDAAGLNMFELRAKARRLQAKTPLSLVIVDYLQLMAGDGRADNRQQEVSNISRSMKQLARELSVPVIAISQLNRAPEARADREPQLADLRESGAIEQDADMVMFLYRGPERPGRPRASSSSRSPRTATARPTPSASASCATTRSSARSARPRTTGTTTRSDPPGARRPAGRRAHAPAPRVHSAA